MTYLSQDNKIMQVVFGHTKPIIGQEQLPLPQLTNEAPTINILPSLIAHQLLLSVCDMVTMATPKISHPHNQGMTVHHANNVDIQKRDNLLLQGCCNENGFWQLSLSEEDKEDNEESKPD